MITLEEFDLAQKILGRDGRPRPQKHNFPYTGIMTCGICGSAITATEKLKVLRTSGHTKAYVFYHCTKRKKSDIVCTQKKYVTRAQLENMIVSELQRFSISKEFKDWGIAILKSVYATDIETEEKVHDAQNNALESAKRELNNLTTLRLRDLINDEEFVMRKKELQDKIIVLTRKISESENDTGMVFRKAEEAFNFASTAIERFTNGTDEDKKEIFLALGWNHSLRDENLYITRDKRYEAIANRRDDAEAEIRRLEPGKTIENIIQNGRLESNLYNLLALTDEVRTAVDIKDNFDSPPDVINKN